MDRVQTLFNIPARECHGIDLHKYFTQIRSVVTTANLNSLLNVFRSFATPIFNTHTRLTVNHFHRCAVKVVMAREAPSRDSVERGAIRGLVFHYQPHTRCGRDFQSRYFLTSPQPFLLGCRARQWLRTQKSLSRKMQAIYLLRFETCPNLLPGL